MPIIRSKEDAPEQIEAAAQTAPAAEIEPSAPTASEQVELAEKQSKTKPAKKRKKKKWIKWVVLLLIVAIVAALVVPRFFSFGATIDPDSITYTTAAVERRSITKSLSGSGTLQPANTYTVTTLVSGEILTSDFEEGDTVEKDEILYELDSTDSATNVEKAQISLDQARRNYSSTLERRYVKAPVAGTVYDLTVRVGDEVNQGQTIASIRDSSVMILKVPFLSNDAKKISVGASATVTLDSTFETLSGKVTAVTGVDTAAEGGTLSRTVTIEVSNPGGLTNAHVASASVGDAGSIGSGTFSYRAERTVSASASGTVASIDVGEGKIAAKEQTILTLESEDIDEQIQNASESLRNAELSLENAYEAVDNYTVRSPISGTIIEKTYKAGDTVESGRQMCKLYDLSYLEMTLSIDELDISSVEVGQSVRITADAVDGASYTGVVTRVSVEGSTSGGVTSYPATVRIDETDGLLPGMNVDAEIVVSAAEDVLAIPNGAVSRGNMVLVTADSPSAANALEQEAPEGYVYVRIETGLSDDSYVEIESGLTEEDTVAYAQITLTSTDEEGLFGDMGGFGNFGGMGGMTMPGGDFSGGSGGFTMPGGSSSGGGRGDFSGGMPGGGF